MPPFEHLHTGAPYPPPASFPVRLPLPPQRPTTWRPSTWYDTGEVVLFDELEYRSTGGHLSGESFPPDKSLATWIPLEKPLEKQHLEKPPSPFPVSAESEKLPEKDQEPLPQPPPPQHTPKDDATQPPAPVEAEAEPPPVYPPPPAPAPTYAEQGVQTDISLPPEASFPPWVFQSWPMPGGGPSGSFGSHPLSYPWLPPTYQQPQYSAATNSTQPLLPLSLPPQHMQAPLPYHQFTHFAPTPPMIHAPMPLHLPLRLPPALESVLMPISDPLDTRYRAARAAERSQQTAASFRSEVAGEKVVRSHGCGVWAFGGTRDRTLEAEREAAWRECGARGPEAWLRAARARRAAYAVPGAVRPPVRWVLVEEGQKIPDDALQTGVEATGEPLYSTRVWWKGGLHLGKVRAPGIPRVRPGDSANRPCPFRLQAANHIHNYASISWDSQEHTTPTFEVLCGPPAHVQWLEIPHGVRATSALFHDFTAVEGGREATGTFIFVAQGEYGLGGAVGLHPGKASAGDDHACIGYGGGEVWIRPFRLLVYTQPSMG
ncbi:hypothetical protein CALCODRAFT_267729 [Calocera cornea HHB12733]|uniref:Uncharacterized protein n=1 Tax=Calocera cornea HHB12733 TaxID=1353952 RepID=A0A165GB09_9BASI|nr:hypothetical protein CALCODRAFT_267729 [Calocera cornea HHB12733]